MTQFAILMPLLALLTSLPACSRSPAPDPVTTRASSPSGDLSPVALAVSPDGQTLYVGCATARQVLVFDTHQRHITNRLPLPGEPSGLELAPDGRRLFVTCKGPASQVCVLDTASGKVLKTLAAGHTALGPVLSRDGKTLFVCNRFNDAVSVLDLSQDREEARIPVAREPVSAALTRDGRFLLVANHLSYLDILTFGAAMPCFLVSKVQIGGWPLFGRLAHAGGTIFVDRSSRRSA